MAVITENLRCHNLTCGLIGGYTFLPVLIKVHFLHYRLKNVIVTEDAFCQHFVKTQNLIDQF